MGLGLFESPFLVVSSVSSRHQERAQSHRKKSSHLTPLGAPEDICEHNSFTP
jgi:hypothetical protein